MIAARLRTPFRTLWRVWPRPWIVLEGCGLFGLLLWWQYTFAKFIPVGFPLLAIAATLYGYYRVAWFHPMASVEYRRFLALSPWNGHEPLPQGPIHLVWQDVLLLSLLAIASWFAVFATPMLVLVIPFAFLGIYLISLIYYLWLGKRTVECFLLVAGIALTVRLMLHPVAMVIAIAALYTVAYFGIRRQLVALANEDPTESFSKTDDSSLIRNAETLAWPWKQLFPASSSFWPTRSMTVAIACLMGWCFHVAMWIPFGIDSLSFLRNSQNEFHVNSTLTFSEVQQSMLQELEEIVPFLYSFLVMIGLFWHLAHFLGPYRAPINPLGRLLTLRWVIPGYDRVFLAPLAATVAAVVFPLLLGWYGIPLLWRYPLALVVVVLALRNVGPELSDWHLTGEHRLTPGMFVSRDQFLRG